VREGDAIVTDGDNRGLNVEVSEEEIRRRLAAWTRPEPRYTSGVLAKYAALVTQADQGAVTRDGLGDVGTARTRACPCP
jgi:dihydroxy-acid dehydratase